MNKIVIVTDSNSDIPASLLKDNIKVIPLSIVMPEEESYSADMVSNKVFCSYMMVGVYAKSVKLNPKDANKTLSSVENGTDIIVIHSSEYLTPGLHSKLEQSICQYCMNNTNSRVCMIDSKTTSMALGLLVLDAALMAENDASFEDIVTYVKNNRSKYHCEFFSDNTSALTHHKVISSRKAESARKRNSKYLFGVTARGLIRPIKRVHLDNEESTILGRISSSEDYAIISSIVDKRGNDITKKVQEELCIDSLNTEISCCNLSLMGAKTVGLCYKKK